MLIYLITNKINGKVYIGQTFRDLKTRKTEHTREANKSCLFAIHRAISKYGEDSFDWEVLRECDTIEALNKLEEYYISIYDSMKSGYNMKSGGLNNLFSDEVKQKMKDNHYDQSGENHWNYGKKATLKTRKRMSISQSGENNGMCGVRRFGKDNPNYGKRWDEEQKDNLRQQKIGTKMSEETKKKISKTMSIVRKEQWKDPIYREKVLKAKGIL